MRYRIILGVYGGEHVVGTTTKEVVDYWRDKDYSTYDIEEHMLNNTVKDIPEKYSLYPFHEQDDIIHSHGVELSEHNRLGILNEDTNETVLEVSLGSFFVRELCYMVDNPCENLEVGQPIIHSFIEEKGTWEYIFDLDEELDPKKLKLFILDLDGTLLIDHVMYDDMYCDFVDGATRVKGFIAGLGETYESDQEIPKDKRLLSYL